MNRRAQYHNYYNMFLSHPPVNPRVIGNGALSTAASNTSNSTGSSC